MLVKILTILTKFVTYYSQYYADIIGSGLVCEAGGVVGATPQKYISCLFVAEIQKL